MDSRDRSRLRVRFASGPRGLTRICAAALLGAALAACPRPVRAQSAAAGATAQALFDQARQLMQQGKYAEACPKFAASQRLDPGVGTQFNLAACYEKLGKTASAWALYLEVAATCRKLGETKREKVARGRADALKPKLSKLEVDVPKTSQVDGLKVQRGSVDLGSALWGVSTPVDPGKVTISASAPGKKPWTGTVEVAAGASAKIAVPPLADAPAAAAPPESTPVTGPAAGPAQAGPPGGDHAVQTTRPIPTTVWIGAGVTGALAVGAVVTGVLALKKKSDFNAINDGNHPKDAKQSAHDSAVSMGVINTVLTGAALVGAGVTAYFYLSRPEKPASGRTYVTPWATAHSGGLVVGGAL